MIFDLGKRKNNNGSRKIKGTRNRNFENAK